MDRKFLDINGERFVLLSENVNRRTSSVKFCSGKILIKLSSYLSKSEKKKVFLKFVNWAELKLFKVDDLKSFFLNDYSDGGRIVTHNKIYSLELIYEEGRGARRNDLSKISIGVIRLFLPINFECLALKKVLNKIVMEDQLGYLNEVVGELNQLYFQEKISKIKFKHLKSRFGSCSKKKELILAFCLLFAPREVFRYVCVHELAHLKEFNHSKSFWSFVELAMPDYKKWDKWLKRNGFMLHVSF